MERSTFFLATPNSAGTVLAAALVSSVVLTGPRPWLTRLLVVAPLTVALTLTQSRIAILAVLAALTVAIFQRSVPWRWAGLVGLATLSLPWLLPSGERLMRATTDGSVGQRIAIWRGTLALLADHPWGVGWDSLMPLMNRWYTPPALVGRFDSCLNEPLMLASAYGLPTLSLALAGIGALAAALLSRTTVLAGASLTALTALLIGGQTQAHVWCYYHEVQAAYCIAVLAGVIALANARPSWHVLAAGAVAGALTTVLLWLAAIAIGTGPWHTVIMEDLVLAQPRTRPTRSTVAVVGLGDVKANDLARWLQVQADAGTAVVDAPAGLWPAFVRPDRCLAHGEAATLLWRSWWNGVCGHAGVELFDPMNLPTLPGPCQGGALTLHVAQGSIFADQTSLADRANALPQVKLEMVPGKSTTWWMPVVAP